MSHVAPPTGENDSVDGERLTIHFKLLRKLASWICGDISFDQCYDQNSLMHWEKKRWQSRTSAMALSWILTGFCGVMWGSVYLKFDLRMASMPPFVYALACLAVLLLLRIINKHCPGNLDVTVFIFGQIQIILMLILPISMHIVLGGLDSSNASCVMSWCILAPAGAIFYCQGPRRSTDLPANRALVLPANRALVRSRPLEIGSSSKFGMAALVSLLPSVLADAHVAITIAVYVAASVAIIACEPLLPAVQPPPLLLRQVRPHTIRRASCIAVCPLHAHSAALDPSFAFA
jgi:hypothetical protein